MGRKSGLEIYKAILTRTSSRDKLLKVIQYVLKLALLRPTADATKAGSLDQRIEATSKALSLSRKLFRVSNGLTDASRCWEAARALTGGSTLTVREIRGNALDLGSSFFSVLSSLGEDSVAIHKASNGARSRHMARVSVWADRCWSCGLVFDLVSSGLSLRELLVAPRTNIEVSREQLSKQRECSQALWDHVKIWFDFVQAISYGWEDRFPTPDIVIVLLGLSSAVLGLRKVVVSV